MISDQGDKISFFDINQSRFFVCSPSIKNILCGKIFWNKITTSCVFK